MSFGEVDFLVFFLPVVLLVHWLVPRRATAQNVVVVLASYVFFASWHPKLLLLLVATTAIHYFVARKMDDVRPPDEAEETEAGRRAQARMRRWVTVAIVYGVGQLLVFKYLGFFAESLNDLMTRVGVSSSLPVLRFVLPVGISFWTLQLVGYQLDVYHGRHAASSSPLAFAAFVAFFPQLISGPIPRGHELLPQLEQPRQLTPRLVHDGCGAFLLGFVGKFLIAGIFGPALVDPVFLAPGDYDASSHWIAIAAYAGQVFCDFAGYSAMAIGLGRLLGVELPKNFDYPFFSKGMLEFWRRWHISLNTWLFDVIYTPLMTGRGWFRGRLDAGFMLVFLISGLWHGATWTFVIWGAVHGVALAVQRRWDVYYRGLCRKDRKWVKRRKTRAYATAAWALTQLFFLVSLVPFRAPTVEAAATFAGGLFVGGAASVFSTVQGIRGLAGLGAAVLLLLAYHLVELGPLRLVRDRFFALPAPVRGVAYGLLIVWLMLFVPPSAGTFIYGQF